MIRKIISGILTMGILFSTGCGSCADNSPNVEPDASDDSGTNPKTGGEEKKPLPKIIIVSPGQMEPGALIENVTYTGFGKNPLGLPDEITPQTFSVGGELYLLASTGGSTVGKFPDGKGFLDFLKSRENIFSRDDSWIVSDSQTGYAKYTTGQGTITSEDEFNDISNWDIGSEYWKRTYCGVMGLTTAFVDGGEYIFAVFHGENKNEIYAGNRYLNSILPKQDYTDEKYAGVGPDGVYNDYAETYFAFASLAVIPADEFKTGVRFDDPRFHKGPVAWPVNGYLLPSGEAAPGLGIRHQTVFADGEFLYIFIIDGSIPRVLRSPLSALGDPASFETVKNGSFGISPLPDGFDKNDRGFFSRRPPASDPLFNSSETFYFTVARLKDTGYYIGVELYHANWPAFGVRLRLSEDLVNWGDPVDIPGAFVQNYYGGTLHYPRIFDSALVGADEVDPNDFFIVGRSRNGIDAVRMSIRLD